MFASSPLKRSTVAGLASFALIVAGCTTDDTDDAAIAPSSSATPITTEATATASTVPDELGSAELPPLSGLDGAIGEASDLALSWLNGTTFDQAAFDASFDPGFREAITFDVMAAGLDTLLLDSPYVVEAVQGSTATEAALLVAGASGETQVLSVAIVAADDPTINVLFIGPPPTFEAPANTAEAIQRLNALGTLRLGVFDASCQAVGLNSSVRASEQAPIGSAFKLWVLAAVVEAVADGSISWDDDVEVRDELDSYRSGITQDADAGSFLTVRTMAERMIEISDNTATNHLMALVGREAVEQAMIDSGHANPGQNLPMMDAREFTIVKFGDAVFRDAYIAADEAERRRILDEVVTTMPLPPLTNIATVVGPIEVETLEWFASPIDLCNALIQLANNDEAAAILGRASGVPDETNRWEQLLFKGGSEPGVLAMAWLAIDSDGERFVIAGGVANEQRVIDEFEAASLLAFVRDQAIPG